jgi:hypothetical protein
MNLIELDAELTSSLYENIEGFEEYARAAIIEEFHNNSYFVFCCLGSFLLTICSINKEDRRIALIFQQANKASELQNSEVDEMLYTTFLEYLTDEAFAFRLGEKELKGRALKLFNELKDSGLFRIPE